MDVCEGSYSVVAREKLLVLVFSLKARLACVAPTICALTRRRSTRCAWAFLRVFLTKDVIMMLHFMSTSSRSQSPCNGAFMPSSTGAIGSPGKEPPSVHFPFVI